MQKPGSLILSVLIWVCLFADFPYRAHGAEVERDEAASRMTDLVIHKRRTATEIVLIGDGVFTQHHAFTLSDPPRIVLDIGKVTHSLDVNTFPSHPEKVRVVLDVDEALKALPEYRIEARGMKLHVFLGDQTVEPPEAPTQVPATALSEPQTEDFLKEGIEQYREENYEEAVEVLLKAREQNPNSSLAAFYLGLAYKQIIDYPNARVHFRDAVTLESRVNEAVVELIDVLYLMNELEEAKQWIEVAEDEEIYPAKVAFLEGAVLQKEGRHAEAIEAFEKAKSLDKSLAQSADFQIAVSLTKQRKLAEARERFRASVVKQPQSDLAAFGRYYEDLLDERIEMERPLHLTLGVYGQYDTNVVLGPSGTPLGAQITNEATRGLLTTARIDYTPMLPDPWLFNAWYGYYGNFHHRNSNTQDIIAHSVFMAPGYRLGRYSLSLATNYSYYYQHGERYLSYLNVGPLFRAVLGDKHLLELSAAYLNREYFDTPLASTGDGDFPDPNDRDSFGLNTYLSWIWLFMEDGFFNAKYEFIDEDTDGINWDYTGHRFYLVSSIPLFRFSHAFYDQSRIDFQFGGEMFFQRYKNTFFGSEAAFGSERKRSDDIYQVSLGLTWEFLKNTSLVAQFDKTWSFSNLEIYEYNRAIGTIGLEYRY
jgi:tetratricopeptide (TPR) repeat protein